MGIDLSRRFFLIGSAATIAAAAVPAAVALPITPKVILPDQSGNGRHLVSWQRRYCEMMFSPSGDKLPTHDAKLCTLKIFREPNGQMIYGRGIDARAVLYWRALLDDEMLVVMPDFGLRIEIEGTDISRVGLAYEHRDRPGAPWERWFESYDAATSFKLGEGSRVPLMPPEASA